MMGNLYQRLGVPQDATQEEIRRAYRRLSLSAHPDRGGSTEGMTLLNQAYETLSDPIRRRQFDARHAMREEIHLDPSEVVQLKAGPIIAYSSTFKAQHKELVRQYLYAPLQKNSMQQYFTQLKSNLYSLETKEGMQYFSDIFSYMRTKSRIHSKQVQLSFNGILTPAHAIPLFIEFLTGTYQPNQLQSVTKYLATNIERIKREPLKTGELHLLEGIHEIITAAHNAEPSTHLIYSIKKITDFAHEAQEPIFQSIVPLFYNAYFRNLYIYALHRYWQETKVFDSEHLKPFNGQAETKMLLEVLLQHLENEDGHNEIVDLVRYVKLLLSMEKALYRGDLPTVPNANMIREQAFVLLDWIPALKDRANKAVLVNIFLQIGLYFQYAACLESREPLKMADEQMALQMYLTCISIGHHDTPDIEMYANIQALKYISAFQYEASILREAIPAVQRRIHLLVDIFPIFKAPQSNIAFLRQEHATIHLMRRLLNNMIALLEYNKTHAESISLSHSAATVLYAAYEACLKNWFSEVYDAQVENKIRLDLIDELLFNKGWTFMDVEQNIASPWIMVARDEAGWLNPTRPLPFNDDKNHTVYARINGVEINKTTGDIQFFMEPWQRSLPICMKRFSLFDVEEMLEKHLTGAIFSLDPVDPEKPYHPFNVMRFGPEQLCETELLNTMLLTDYILKFLTTNQEVQGQYPFEQRSASTMMQKIPPYLRKIITDFQAKETAGAIHRFWIEAEEIDLAIQDNASTDDSLIQIALDDIKMLVKTHRMDRDLNGELKDTTDEEEGWPIYILTPVQFEELEQGKRIIQKHAMIFVSGLSPQLIYWENNRRLKTHMPLDFQERWIRLTKFPRTSDEKLIVKTKNMPLIYYITETLALQAEQSPRYSAEFSFAHEFTTHYDEFAYYIPEFGRLKELCKISVLVRYLSNLRMHLREEIQALDNLMTPNAPSLSTEAYLQLKQGQQAICQNVQKIFQDLQQKASSNIIRNKWHEELNRIYTQIRPLDFSTYSDEVNDHCNKMYEQALRNNPRVESWRIRQQVEGMRAEIARKLSESKQSSCRQELTKIFAPRIESMLGAHAFSRALDAFMKGNHQVLVDAMTQQERKELLDHLKTQFPKSSNDDFIHAIDDHDDKACTRISVAEARHQLQQQKVKKDNFVAGFARIHLGEEPKSTHLSNSCFWVPASVRHEVKQTPSGQSRYSFFVYGGVNLQPRVNVVPGGSLPMGGSAVGGGTLSNVNAQAALNNKLRALQKAQDVAVRTERLDDGRIRYYAAERSSRTPGPTRGNAYVTEHNPKTGQVRAWAESYDHRGNVTRVHPKMIDGQMVRAQHYPLTGVENRQQQGFK